MSASVDLHTLYIVACAHSDDKDQQGYTDWSVFSCAVG